MPSEQLLSEILTEFAQTLLTDLPIQAILDHLVLRIVEVLPITSAGVTLIAPGTDPEYVAASDEAALRYEQLQSELGEGPCLAAYYSGEPVSVADLREEPRFPKFVPRALAEGLGAVFTFPLRNGDEPLGALDLYRETPGALDRDDDAAARTLASVTSVYLVNARARHELQESSLKLRDDSLHDALTGLPNRVLLLERLDHALLRSERTGVAPAILFLDLDHFKEVNDRNGHGVGDELLIAVARRLRAVLRPSDTVARLSGDEFVMLCEDLNDAAALDAIATRVGACLADKFVLSTTAVAITASIGTALSVRGDATSDRLLRDGDTAMYQAKRKGGDRHQGVDAHERQRADRSAGMALELSHAQYKGELRTNYQPVVKVDDGSIVGVETFLRWEHASQGMVPASVVVPLAEESGLMAGIGQWVLEQACSDLHRWAVSDTGTMKLTVNVTAQELLSDDYVTSVERVLSGSDTEPARLTLDLAENVFDHGARQTVSVLRDLRRLGVRIALDDFGAGNALLKQLGQLPIDVVKLDRAFVANIGQDPTNDAVVAAVIDLAHVLGLTVVAEGIEYTGQHEELVALGCDFCQGYYYARPMTAGAFERLVNERNTASV